MNLQCLRVKSAAKSVFFSTIGRLRASPFRLGRVEKRSRRIRGACNTVRVEPGSDPALDVTLEPEPPLGAAQSVYADLGPISPELALVDNVLAERARMLLPEPSERPRPARRPASGRPEARHARGAKVAQAPKVGQGPARRRRSRWPRTVLLALLIFAAGAFSGGFLGEHRPASQRVPLEVEAGGPNVTAGSVGTQPATRPAASTAKREPRRSEPVTTWAANVLGVSANVDGKGVRLVWQRPSDSDHVVVLRASNAPKGSVVVFHAPGTSYRDPSARACTEYRYTIVNYDRHGHRSTGVPTSVMTQGCT